jgi:hypothetical protein
MHLECFCRLGFIIQNAPKFLNKRQLVDGIKLDETARTSKDDGKSCLHGSVTCIQISRTREHEAPREVGDEVHTDVLGPATVETPQHMKYWVSFMDEALRYTVVMMHTKDETLDSFEDNDAPWEKEHGIKIKILHYDNGGRYQI